MPTFEQALSDYGKAITPDKPFPAYLGAFIAGTFQIVVPTNPALAYVRHLDNTSTTAYHHNRVDLYKDPTLAANQNISIALYYDEYDHLAIWGLAPPEAGANLQTDPNTGAGAVKAVIAGTGVTVDSTDPTRPIVAASGGGAGNRDLFVQTATQTVANTTSETTLFGAGIGTLTLPANWFVIGREIEIYLSGLIITKTLLPGNITITFKLGGSAICLSALYPITADLDGVGWEASIRCACVSLSSGTSYNFSPSQGKLLLANNDMTSIQLLINGISAILDISGTLAIDVTWTWDTADANNLIETFEAFVRYIDPN